MILREKTVFSIPAAQRHSSVIWDADWKEDFGIAALVCENNRFKIVLEDRRTILPNLLFPLKSPLIRWLDEDLLLLANPRNENGESNLFVINPAGRLIDSFNVGDGIMDIQVSADGIWVSYFDEGIFGSGISTQALVLFSIQGVPLFKYSSDLKQAPTIVSCDAICLGENSTVWLFPELLPGSKPALLQLDFKKKRLNSFKASKQLNESTALAVRGNDAFFAGEFDSDGKLNHLEVGKQKPEIIGKVDGLPRGLGASEHNHFIAATKNSVKLYRVSERTAH